MKQTALALGIIAILLLGVAFTKQSGISVLGNSVPTFDQTTVTTSTFGLTVNTVVAQNPNRVYWMIQNNGSEPLYCLLDGSVHQASSTVTSTLARPIGHVIDPPRTTSSTNTFWEMRGYVGNVNCTAASNVSTTVITSP